MAIRLANFFGDPFAIATVSFGFILWIIALAGAAASPQGNFPRFTWWGIVYEILIIVAIFFLYMYNIIELYKFTLVGLLSVAFLYTSNSTNQLVYNTSLSSNACCAAGCIMLSMLNFIWILYFGGHPESPTNQFIDSFSLKLHTHNHGQLPSAEANRIPSASQRILQSHHAGGALSETDDEYKYISPVNLPAGQENTQNKSSTTPYVSLSQLNGLENFSNSDVHKAAFKTNTNTNSATGSNQHRQTIYNDTQSNTDVPGITFRYKAKALYSYEANPDDINEISFVKDEVMEVDDIDGKWWQARRANGQVGICPSNYVKLLD